MRQLAWYNSAPKEPKRAAKDQPPPKTRGERVKATGGEPLMPDVTEEAEYLLGYMHDLGWFSSGAMGRSPLSCQEIACWSQGTETPLAPWEFSALRAMSKAYLVQLHESEAPDCQPPFGNPTTTGADREVVGKRVGDAFKALMLSQRKTPQ